MEQKDKYIDKSGDKKYFTQIPNMIINHSTAYEQSLYLVMKRLAGEGGNCYASLNFLAEKIGVHKTTISKTITKLLKRKWITETDKTKVKGGYTRTFVIIDLWPRNIKEYESNRGGAGMTTNQGGAQKDGSGAVVDGSGAQSDTSKKSNKNNKEDIAPPSAVALLRSYFTERCKKLKGFEPEMAFGKEGQLLKEKLKRYSVEQLETLIDQFFNSKIGEDLGYTLSICLSAPAINQWLAGKLERPKKPFYRGDPMIQKDGKWHVIHQGEWLEFAGEKEEIEWK